MAYQEQKDNYTLSKQAAINMISASHLRAPIKYRGLARGPYYEIHRVKTQQELAAIGDHVVPAKYKYIQGIGNVPYFAPTAKGAFPTVYDPAGDADGDFTSCKFMPNNNCYNYGCDIATNSFAQPGRASGIPLSLPLTGEMVVKAATADGLKDIGKSYPTKEQLDSSDGHCVALVIAQPYGKLFDGDYHWVRFDQKDGCWSQKDGGDQMTNFDFAGNKIEDPSKANWTVNGGTMTLGTEKVDVVFSYDFYTFMFVPKTGVNIF